MGYQSNSIALGGWGTNSVTNLNILKSYGVTNMFRDITENPSMYFVATKGLTRCVNYIRRHYSPTAEAYLVKVTQDEFPIYRVASDPHPDFDTSVLLSVKNNTNIHYSYNISQKDGSFVLSGYLYADEVNSFTSNIYLGLKNIGGVQSNYYTTQTYSDTLGDLTHGQYGSFTVTLPADTGLRDIVELYLEADGQVYYLCLGSVASVIQASAE